MDTDQEHEEPKAVLSTPEEEDKEPRDQGVKISAAGMQGSVVESSASHNARQQSTSTVASSRPKPVSSAAPSAGKQIPDTFVTYACFF